MANLSLFQKLAAQLGENGLIQAAKAEGAVVKAAGEIPESLLAKIQSKLAPKMPRPDSVEKLPTRAELDALEKSNLGSDVSKEFRETDEDLPGFIPKSAEKLDVGSIPEIPSAPTAPLDKKGVSPILKAAGAATLLGAGASAYWGDRTGASDSWTDEEKYKNINEGDGGGLGAGQTRSLKETVTGNLSSAPTRAPRIPVENPGKVPEPYSPGKFAVDDSTYQKKLQELKTAEEKATDRYETRANRAEWASVAERVGHALAQFGAAKQGMKSGQDLSNVKFDKIDWDKIIGRYGSDLDREAKSLDGQRDLESDSFKSKTAMEEKQFGRGEDAKQIAKNQENRLYEKKLDAAARAKEKNVELDIAEAQRKNARAEDLGTYEEKQKIEAKYRAPKERGEKESPSEKRAREKEEALRALHSAYLDGDEKELAKARAGATKFLNPQEAIRLNKAAESHWWTVGREKPESVLESILAEERSVNTDSSNGGEDAMIQAYADKYNLPYSQARDIMIKRGYTPGAKGK